MARSVVSAEERRERVAERLAAAQETLAAEIAALHSGEDWQRFLDLQAQLHTYSPNNVLLIAAQHAQAFADGLVDSPDPGWVAGFHTWRALGRSVNRGQHGYMVLAPCRYERRVAIDPAGQVRPIGRHGSVGEGERVESQGAGRLPSRVRVLGSSDVGRRASRAAHASCSCPGRRPPGWAPRWSS